MSLIELACTANNAVLLRRDDPWDQNGGMSLGAKVICNQVGKQVVWVCVNCLRQKYLDHMDSLGYYHRQMLITLQF